MIRVLVGDLFASRTQTLVNTVNCVGVMGKGIALEFKKRFPEMYEDYERRCERKEVRLGHPYLWKGLLPPWVLNFPTKDHWRSVARLADIVEGLRYLVAHYKEWGIESIAVPPLGCGYGQLEWRVVGPTLYRFLKKMEVPVELYAPHGTPHEELALEFLGRDSDSTAPSPAMPEPQWIKPGCVALVEILRRIEEHKYHWPVGRTTFQKIAYVATREGVPTGLTWRKSSYGPFSAEVKGLTTRLVNNGIVRERRLGRMYQVSTGPTFMDARTAYAQDLASWDAPLNRVASLFVRANTDEAEVIATVLFAAQDLRERSHETPSEGDVLDEVMHWKQRRRPPLKQEQVALTIRNLAALRWLDVRPSEALPLPQEELLDV